MLQRKKSRNLKPRHFIHIYTNGYTEVNYFTSKKIQCNKKNVKIEPFFENASNPVQMLKLIEKKYHIRELHPKDKIFCVIDVDDITDSCITEAIAQKAKFIELILSNPNFELWLLLHFKFYTHQFSKEETVAKLKSFIPDYVKPDIISIYPKLSEKEKMAIENAVKLERLHNKDKINLYSRSANPSTGIHKIIHLINSCEG